MSNFEVVKDIRDPNLWRDVPPDEIWARYAKSLDQRVTLVFGSERPHPVVNPRPPVFEQEERPAA